MPADNKRFTFGEIAAPSRLFGVCIYDNPSQKLANVLHPLMKY